MDKGFRDALRKKLRELNTRLSSLSEGLNYRGESFLQSRLFLCGISLFISIFIWFFVALDGNSDAARTVSVDIKYRNLPRGFSMYAPNKKVEVKLVGKINSLSSVHGSDVIAEVDLSNLQTGKYNLPIRLEVPSFARIRSWQPSLAEVEIYRRVERTIPVTISTEGTPPDGMVLSSIDVEPARASVSGPEPDVMAVSALEVTVPLDKLDSNGELTAPIEVRSSTEAIPGEYGTSRITLAPLEAKVKVAFENEIVGERIPVRVSVVGQPVEGLQVESVKVIPDSVSIRGKSAAVKKMQSLVLPPVDISGLDQNIQLMIPMQPAKLDPGIEISGTDRARVEIKLSKKLGTRTFAGVPLMTEGVEGGHEWKLSPQTVTVTIEGPQLEIESLTGSHAPCELYVDLSNIVSKQANLPVLVRNLKKEFQVVQIEPDQIIVTRIE